MLDCFLKNKPAIVAMLSGDLSTLANNEETSSSDESEDDNTDQEDCEFTKNDWKQISFIVDILKPIYTATLFVEGRHCHARHIIPLFKAIKFDLVDQPVTQKYEAVRVAIVNGLESRLKGIIGISLSVIIIILGWKMNRLLVFTTILDPAFKLSLLPSENWSYYKEEIVKELLSLNKSADATQSVLPKPQSKNGNPFARIMAEVPRLAPEQMDLKIKLAAVSSSPPVMAYNFQYF